MAVRNFWIEADIDGRKTRLAGGPVRKDGGFDLTVLIREDGEPVEAVEIRGRAQPDGRLRLYVESVGGNRGSKHGVTSTIGNDAFHGWQLTTDR